MSDAHRIPLDRPASEDELRWLAIMLEGLPAEFDIYRDQLDGLRVDGKCGCATVNLAPQRDAPLGPHKRAIIGDGKMEWTDGTPGDVLVFIIGGMLSFLEFVYYADGKKAELKPRTVRVQTPRAIPSGSLARHEGNTNGSG